MEGDQQRARQQNLEQEFLRSARTRSARPSNLCSHYRGGQTQEPAGGRAPPTGNRNILICRLACPPPARCRGALDRGAVALVRSLVVVCLVVAGEVVLESGVAELVDGAGLA